MAEAGMNSLRIAIVDHVGMKAGMECYDQELRNALARAGAECVVYSNFDGDRDAVVKAFRFSMHENWLSVIRWLDAYRRIASLLKKRDVTHCVMHGFRFGFVEWLFMKIIAGAGVRIFLIVHDPESLIGKKTMRYWKDAIFGLSEKLIVHNAFSRQQLLNSVSSDQAARVLVIPHGNFIHNFAQGASIEQNKREFNIHQDQKCILFFGQIKESKGLDILIEAFAKTDSDCCLVIAGRMRRHSFEKYEALIGKYTLNDRVRLWIGYVAPEMRDRLIRASDIVVLPYRKVYQSGVMLMAMSAGKAVIASDLVPNKEMITDGRNGFLFKSESASDLYRVLTEVIRDDKRRSEVAGAGMDFVRERNNWDGIANEWIKQFQL